MRERDIYTHANGADASCSLGKLSGNRMIRIFSHSLLPSRVSEKSHFSSHPVHISFCGETSSESIYAMCMCCSKVQRSEKGKRARERERDTHTQRERRENG